MAQRNRVESRDSATEPEFYLPAGVASQLDTSRFERLWSALFNHRVEPPR